MRINREIAHYAIIIFLVTFAARATNNMIGTTAPLLAKYDLLFPNYLVGFLASAVTAVNLASIVFVNTRLPGQTRRLLFIISNALILALLPTYFLANSFNIWVISILTGFAYGIIMPNILTSASIVGDQFTAERILVLYTLALSTSLVAGPLLETYLLTRLGYRYVFLLFIPLALISFALSFKIRFPPDPREKRSINAGRVVRNKGLISALLANSTYSIPFVVFTAFIAIYAQSIYHVSRYLAYFSFVPFFLTSFLTRLYLTIHVPRRLFRPMLVSIALTIIGIALLYVSPNYIMFMISMLILGIPHGSVYPLSTLMISRGTSIEERNAANSYFAAFQGVLGIAVPALFGISTDLIGIKLSMALLLIPPVITIAIIFTRFYLGSGLETFKPEIPSSR